MGGGAGVSVHGRFRVATENTVFVSLLSGNEVICNSVVLIRK